MRRLAGRNLKSVKKGVKLAKKGTLFHRVPFTLFTNSLVHGLFHVILRHYENLTKSGMPRGCKLPWVMYEEQVINVWSDEMKQFDWSKQTYRLKYYMRE